MNRRHFLKTTAATAGLAAATFALRRPLHAQTPSAPAPSVLQPFSPEALLARIRPPAFPDRDYRITDFGAAASDARPAIQAAINRCAADGGGRIIIPRGQWNIAGPIHLKSNTHLHLDDAAHLRFLTDDPARYLPVVLTRWEGTEAYNYSPFIYAYQAVNVAITGNGLIDGNSNDTFSKWWGEKQIPDQTLLRKMGHEGTPVPQRIFGPGHFLRPNFLQFFSCSNILLDGPRLVDSPFWVAHAVACNNITVRRLHVDSNRNNNDGFDPEACTDVLIEDCVFKTGDDGIAIKSGRDQDAWRIGRPTENVLIRRCEMHGYTGGNGLAIGSEMSAGVRNIHVENLRISTTKTALNIKGNLDRGGFIENVTIRDVTVGKAQTLILITTDYRKYYGGNFPPRFRDFHFENIHCEEAALPISASGVPASLLENITLRDIQVTRADKPPLIHNTKNLRAENITINNAPVDLKS